MITSLIEQLGAQEEHIRLESLAKLMECAQNGTFKVPARGNLVNNHIHTSYSFSPYTPTQAVFTAWQAGLATAGLMDHDTMGGAKEFVQAGQILGLPTTIGFECRVRMDDTHFAGRRINNPDQDSVAYMAMHGLPYPSLPRVEEVLAPYRVHRNTRNRAMIQKLNEILAPHHLCINFDQDVVPLSQYAQGGTITERHLCCALAQKLTMEIGRGKPAVGFLKNTLQISIPSSIEEYLLDDENPYYLYDLLGVIKSDLLPVFYLPATDEMMSLKEFVALGKEIGGITAYAYLGDVLQSVTGDKKAQAFEDAYLDDLFHFLKRSGVQAVTYMPTRNTMEQLSRVRQLADEHQLFEISGEDINSPRQSFLCKALEQPEFVHLTEAAWALIGHEKMSAASLRKGMFAHDAILDFPDLISRCDRFASIGRSSFR